MSCSVSISGLRDLDGKFKDMCDLKAMCDKQKMSYPKELVDYFCNGAADNEDWPIDNAEDIKEMNKEQLELALSSVDISEARTGSSEYNDPTIIDISKLPPDAKYIKVYLSC